MFAGPSSLRRCCVLLVVLACAIALTSGAAVAGANERPLAEAGLDQQVSVGATVYLDAGGSTDPDGAIESVRWTIEAPDGTTVEPGCTACRQTQFRSRQVGRYDVTVTVTDDDGATASDTLYVNATDGVGPTVAIVGPSTTEPDTTTNFTVLAVPGDAPIDEVGWYVEGEYDRSLSFSADQHNVTVPQTFLETGSYRLRAEVRDAAGRTNATTFDVSVSVGGGGGSPRICGFAYLYAEEGIDATQPCSEIFEADLHDSRGGTETWTDLTGDGEITFPADVIKDKEDVTGGAFQSKSWSSDQTSMTDQTEPQSGIIQGSGNRFVMDNGHSPEVI